VTNGLEAIVANIVTDYANAHIGKIFAFLWSSNKKTLPVSNKPKYEAQYIIIFKAPIPNPL